MDISVNIRHDLNELFPIDVTEEGIDISFNDEQLQNELFPIEVIFGGIAILLKLVKSMNKSSILFITLIDNKR